MALTSNDLQDQRIGLATLWNLWHTHRITIVPIEQYASSHGLWERAPVRLSAAGARIEQGVRGDDRLALEQQRWQTWYRSPRNPHTASIRRSWPGAQRMSELVMADGASERRINALLHCRQPSSG